MNRAYVPVTPSKVSKLLFVCTTSLILNPNNPNFTYFSPAHLLILYHCITIMCIYLCTRSIILFEEKVNKKQQRTTYKLLLTRVVLVENTYKSRIWNVVSKKSSKCPSRHVCNTMLWVNIYIYIYRWYLSVWARPDMAVPLAD